MANAVTLLGMWKWSCKVVCTRDGIKVGSIRSLHPGSVEEEAEEVDNLVGNEYMPALNDTGERRKYSESDGVIASDQWTD